MSDLPQISLDNLRKLSGDEIRRLPSLELVDKGGYICHIIIPCETGGMSIWDEIKTSADTIGVRSNIVVPPESMRIVGEINKPVAYPNLVKARAKRKLKKKAVSV